MIKLIQRKTRWFVYKLLAQASDFKRTFSRERPKPRFTGNQDFINKGKNSIWVFCSTIGELNACKPLIDKFTNYNIILITDKSMYSDAYLQAYPSSVVVELQHYWGEVQFLYKKFPPEKLIVCEIPCFPHDSPCRLGYEFLLFLKQQGVQLFVVNGWLYGGIAGCKQDSLEREWFGADFLNLFDKLMVQSAEVKEKLISLGSASEKIHVTGNMKFDALTLTNGFEQNIPQSDCVFEFLQNCNVPVIVAGCVSFSKEFGMIVKAYKRLLEKMDVKLVITPRHPENLEKMKLMKEVLAELSNSNIQYRSEIVGNDFQAFDVLVLDTFGELSKYYSVADISYVGANHNLLEPIVYGKAVATSNEWDEKYPSYPVYDVLNEKSLVQIVDDDETLFKFFVEELKREKLSHKAGVYSALKNLEGAVDKNYEFIVS